MRQVDKLQVAGFIRLKHFSISMGWIQTLMEWFWNTLASSHKKIAALHFAPLAMTNIRVSQPLTFNSQPATLNLQRPKGYRG